MMFNPYHSSLEQETIDLSHNLQSSAPPKSNPVNRQCLDELTLGDSELLKELIQIYLEQFQQQLNEIQFAIETNDAQMLRNVAHKSVGGNATFGMMTVVPDLRLLEKMGREEQLEGASESLAAIQNEFELIRQGCQQILCELA